MVFILMILIYSTIRTHASGLNIHSFYLCTQTLTALTFTVIPTEATCTVTHAGSYVQGPSILTHTTTGW